MCPNINESEYLDPLYLSQMKEYVLVVELIFVQLPVIRECSYKLMFQTPNPDQWIKEYSRHVSYTPMDLEGSATPVGNLSLDAM